MLPGPFEIVVLGRAAEEFVAWKNGQTFVIHSSTPDLKSFQAGYLAGLDEMIRAKRVEAEAKSKRRGDLK